MTLGGKLVLLVCQYLPNGPRMQLIETCSSQTGASMGIGEAIADALAAAGASLILISRSEDKLQAISNKLSTSYPAQRFIYRAVDIGNHDLVDRAISSAVEKLGHIDILINNVSCSLRFVDHCMATGLEERQ